MDGNLLDRFEKQMEALLRNYERLKQDNTKLRDRQNQLVAECGSLKQACDTFKVECDALKNRHEETVGGIQRIIERLQTVEIESETL